MPAAEVVAPTKAASVAAPSFGQIGIDGEEITFRADEVNVTAAAVKAAQASTDIVVPLVLSSKSRLAG